MKSKLICPTTNVFLILLILIFTNCSEKKSENTHNDISLVKKDSVNVLSIHKVGELRFRRSYADRMFREMSDKEADSIKKSNPNPDQLNDTILVERFQMLDIVSKEGNLFRNKSKFNNTKEFGLTGQGKENLNCKIVRTLNKDMPDLYNLIVINGRRSVEIEIEGHYGLLNEDIKYLLLDIIPGGYKEFVVLNEYYVMNGDNSDLYIYEIKS